jgi:uncharacterized protein DUF6281
MRCSLLLLPLVCGLAGCGDSKEHASSGVGATCIATVVRNGVTYYGEHVDRPARTDGSAGTGVIPPCSDTSPPTKAAAEQVDLLRVQGVDPKVAVVVASQPEAVYRVRR